MPGRKRAIQCRKGAAVILYGYECAGIMAAAVFHRGGRAPAFRPRRRGAAYLAAAAVARDPRARGAARAWRSSCAAAGAWSSPPRALACCEEARRLIGQLERAVQELRGMAAGEQGRLRIGFVSLADYGVLPGLLKSYKSAHRPGRARPARDAVARAGDGARRGRARLRAPAARRSAARPGSSTSWCSASASSLRCPRRHRLARGRGPDRDERAGAANLSSWCRARSRRGLYDIVRGLAARAGIALNVAQEAIQMQTVVSLVSSGLGVAIVPASVANLGRRGVVYRRARRPSSAPRAVAGVAAPRAERGGARVRGAWRAGCASPVLVHPQIDPIAFSIGPLAVRWYGLMYLVGLRRRLVARGRGGSGRAGRRSPASSSTTSSSMPSSA